MTTAFAAAALAKTVLPGLARAANTVPGGALAGEVGMDAVEHGRRDFALMIRIEQAFSSSHWR